MALPAVSTRHLFFTGKGGVGKTSLSCATGLALAEAGKKVLIVSTDPASNLDEVLGIPLGSMPTAIPGALNLYALNIDPVAAAAEYRERMVAPYRNILPAAAIQSMEEQFSGACTVEIAAFDEFSKLLGDPTATADFDHIIFDTAPTGHTLRLLTLPSAWSGFIASSTGGASCLGPLAGLEKQKALYAATVARLSDPKETTVVLVSRPEQAALAEAERTRTELATLGVSNQYLAINGVFTAQTPGDAIADAMTRRGVEALAAMPAGLTELPGSTTAFVPKGTVGLESLRLLASEPGEQSATQPLEDTDPPTGLMPLAEMVDQISRSGHGVIMTMGKGGVGKTTLAAAIAASLARRGHAVHLSTTDPAAHVAQSIAEAIPGLTVSRIDPAAEVAKYTAEVLAKAGNQLDQAGLALLEEDLRSPCTEEIAVFRAFAQAVHAGNDGFVVLDTAPTGHTLLLLDAAEAYHREVLRTRGEMPESVVELLPRLRDPNYTHVFIVTLAEATPVHEAERLQADLARARIKPYAWIINQSLYASGTTDPLLHQRGLYELPFIRRVVTALSPQTALLPWLAEPPVGSAGLARIVLSDNRRPASADFS
ncbi:MAG: arsenical pump-driving ATPase [Rhodocyclaceae bacterium]|nr:arsenical pump-driving ATPase [Rhodocyclaceae bacterium]MDZ4215137.1 arsenical pump-driving ATPase [Rhodocyclaceae bacterium]